VLLGLEGPSGGEAALAAFLRGWVGPVRWSARSPFRPEHKRRNWFVGVGTLAVPVKLHWTERELHWDTMRASGPGGQNVNKTESAVRLTHVPTGLSVVAREERSQHQNRRLALARLAALFDAQGRALQGKAAQDRWAQHDDLERGNPVRLYAGPDFTRAV
jgi:peptide chain release factor